MTPKKTTAKPASASVKKDSGAAGKPAAGKKTASKTGASGKKTPTYEEISSKANEIYLERIAKGEPGDSESDWHKALKILQDRS